ncbi:hypothetical protein FOFC_02842 [Fusarium oxysporum]|nr:hypothetical protein FOFC_02842 [Fusarium oxysporum]
MWTSSEQKAAYQAIVVHFVDAETRGVAQALLSLREFKGSHNGKLQAKAFLEVVEEYDLRGKVGYFTMDNHDANDTMLDDIAKEIDGLDPVARRLRCSGHIMNLIVQAFLFRSKAKKIQEDEREGVDEAYERLCRLSEKEEGGIFTKAQATEEWREFSVLGKLHNLCIYSRSSTSIYNDFKAEIGRALPRDNDTRWNSWFRLIDVAIEKRAKFMDWIQENHAKIEKDALDHNDWNELGDIHAFLQVFHQISVRQGRENTLDEVLSHMDFLHHHFTRTKNRAFSGPRFYARFHVAWLKFEKYYQLTEQAPVYVAGILLCRMAIDIFCIPPMSTEAERIFSGARRQVTWDRSSMSAKMVEASIRHTAVHRLRTNSAGLERFLADAENLAGVLGDNTFTQAISQLRLDTQATLTELIRNKQFIQLQLEKAQEEIARQRAELNQKEQEILVRMASEDRKYRDMAGERLERALGLMGDLRVASIGQGAVLESIDDIEDDPLSDDDSDFDHAEQFEDCSEA